jgi:hypothetical protein
MSFAGVIDPGANASAAELRLSAVAGVRQTVTRPTEAHSCSPPATAKLFTAARSYTIASSMPGNRRAGRPRRQRWSAARSGKRASAVGAVAHPARPGFRGPVPPALQQQDQWRHAAPLAAPGQPGSFTLITSAIGDGWVTDLSKLRGLTPLADDRDFRDRFLQAKREAKRSFAHWLKATTTKVVNPDTMFDSQVKRLHEYKRQLLNVLHVIVRYNQLRENPALPTPPRTVFFAGKAAPAYQLATGRPKRAPATWSAAAESTALIAVPVQDPSAAVAAAEILTHREHDTG